MVSLSRRDLLQAGVAAGVVSLAGCAAQDNLAPMRADTALLISGLRGMRAELAALPAAIMPAATLAGIELDIQEATMFANDIAMAQTAQQATMPVQSMADAVASAAQAVAALHVPPHVRSVFVAAEALLPAIETAIGRPVETAFYSPEQARLILRQAAAQPA